MTSFKIMPPADKKALYKYIAWQFLKIMIVVLSLLKIISAKTQKLDQVWYKLHLNQDALLYLLILLPFLAVLYYIIRNSTFNNYHRYADFSTKKQIKTYLTALAWVAPLSGIILASYIFASCSVLQRILLFVVTLTIAFLQVKVGIKSAAEFHEQSDDD